MPTQSLPITIEQAIVAVSRGRVSDELTLFARRPWSWGAEARFVLIGPYDPVPQDVVDAGLEYVLSVVDIAEILPDVLQKRLGSRALAEYVVHYATFDCAPAWISDVPDR